MEKITNNHEGSKGAKSGLEQAFDLVDYYVGDLFGVAWKVAVVFAVWISAAFYSMTSAGTAAGTQISAIAFWFGWLFLGATIGLGVVVTILGMLDRVRKTRTERKY